MKQEVNETGSERLEIKDLKTFLCVAEAGSIRGAASALSVGQSAVSRRIQKAEEAFGVSLFERKSDGVRLTPPGRNIIHGVRSILTQFASLTTLAQASAISADGELRLGTTETLGSVGLQHLMTLFTDNHKGVRLSFVDSDQSTLFQLLSDRRVDVGVVCGDPVWPPGDTMPLFRKKIFLVVPSSHALSDRPKVGWEDLSELDFIVTIIGSGPTIRDHLIRRMSRVGKSVKITEVSVFPESLLSLVQMGVGATILAEDAIEPQRSGISFIPIEGEETEIQISAYWLPQNDNPALRRFLSLARIEAVRNGLLS